MTRPATRRIWDVDHAGETPEGAYRTRRAFLKRLGLAGAGAGGVVAAGLWGRARSSPIASGDETLANSTKPIAGSAFAACAHNAKYSTNRPVTDELDAAQYNNFYEFGLDKDACWRAAQKLTVRPWTVEVGGLVDKPKTFDIDDLIRRMPCEERMYRFRCVERWAMVVPWSGFPLAALMKAVEPLSAAKYVRFVSFLRPEEAIGQRPGSGWTWPYYEGLTIEEAANELTFVATGLYGHDIPRQHGAPFRMVLPWKYGYKGAKSVVKIEFVEARPKTFWNDAQPLEYGFYSNVDPAKPHPRWSQKTETMIGTNKKHDTMLYNGYGDLVAHLYNGDEH